MLVRTLVEKRRAAAVRTIASDRPLMEAAAFLCGADTAPLIVTQGGLPVGVLGRGDILARLLRDPDRAPGEMAVGDAMNPTLVTVGADERIDDTLAMMTASGIDHVPVVEESRFVGILSSRVLCDYRLEALAAELRHLQNYITDLQEAPLD